MSELWGIWGGRPPGGWCSFRSSHASADHIGYAWVGTREEAERGIAEFPVSEFDYQVVPWAAEREPVGDSTRKPTPPQRKVLQMILDGMTDWNELHARVPGYSRISDALMDRGWIMSARGPSKVLNSPLKVTSSGRAALSRCKD